MQSQSATHIAQQISVLPPQRQYASRIRTSSTSKPLNRSRISPVPSSSQTSKVLNSSPAPTQESSPDNFPTFPPPGIVLHHDDATSKVFQAIGRSFLSVDNRAMTIKDLADMTLKYGLMCQNVSAASQAITTYIRSHMHRCDVQQDLPLLLRHTLSGTPADDDLLPALHSRSGGAHCPADVNRPTNFRKGTMVWYLSKAAGGPCPFARANIRLCDYVEPEQPSAKDLKRGFKASHLLDKKRKRPQRSCAAKGDDSETDDCEIPKPPPKVKLTLRLQPSLGKAILESRLADPQAFDLTHDSESEESMSVDSEDDADGCTLPPYPCRSISIPGYTPTFSSFTSLLPKSFSLYSCAVDEPPRSPSLPASIPSEPPESDDEIEDDEPSAFFSHHRYAGSDADSDLEFDSPGPRSPSAPVMNPLTQVAVKEESNYVQGIDNLWDDMEFSLAKARSPPIELEFASSSYLPDVKVEGMESWAFDSYSSAESPWPTLEADESVKEEEIDVPLLALGRRQSSPAVLSELPSPFEASSTMSTGYYTPDSYLKERRSSDPACYFAGASSADADKDVFDVHSFKRLVSEPPNIAANSQLNISSSLSSMMDSMTELPPLLSPTTIAPSNMWAPSRKPNPPAPVVVHTCEPCSPPISATQIEGISVYQMTLGSALVLRRIDTDFVNLFPIANHVSVTLSHAVPSAEVIKQGSHAARGVWVPLAVARSFIREHPLPDTDVDVFLSDTLFERFPSVLQDLHRSNAQGRSLNHFGPLFSSTMDEQRASVSAPSLQSVLQWANSASSQTVIESTAHPIPTLPILTTHHDDSELTAPLSPTEKEMFTAYLCFPEENVTPESVQTAMHCEDDNVVNVVVCDDEESDVETPEVFPTKRQTRSETAVKRSEGPLRRSNRLAKAVAARSPIRTRRRGKKSSA